jgi:hypothetical protein
VIGISSKPGWQTRQIGVPPETARKLFDFAGSVLILASATLAPCRGRVDRTKLFCREVVRRCLVGALALLNFNRKPIRKPWAAVGLRFTRAIVRIRSSSTVSEHHNI